MADDGQQQADAQAKADAEAKAKADADKWGDWWDEKVEISKAELDKLRADAQETANKATAVAEERRARKEAEAKLKAIDDEKEQKKEEDMKKKWEYETLIKQKDEKIKLLEEESGKYKASHEKLTAETTAENEKLLKEIPADEQEFVKEAIEWKDLMAQNKLLKNFSEKFKKPDFGKKPWGDNGAWGTDKDKADDEEAKKGWFKKFAGKIAQDVFKRKQ